MSGLPFIQASDLVLARGGRRLLDRVSLAVGSGEAVAIVGPNGAGKSTLLRALTGEWAVASGSVQLFGEPLATWRANRARREALARHLAVMTQQPRLDFAFSVREVIELGRLPWRGAGRAADRAVVDEILAALRLEAFAERSYLTLSGGERQRVQAARVLAQLWAQTEGGVLLLDEPTSALDLAQQMSVLEAAFSLTRRGIAVVAVLHDLNTALAWCQRAIVMQAGRVVADAPVREALRPETVEAVYGVPLDRELAGRPERPVLVLRCDNRDAKEPTASPLPTDRL
ncbi:MAG: heme ABC transporter ATP-binding protein [Burkholderiales bacterium]|nr:heme ABC transporter ATP-binding protein [Burkholderiales bacterium]